MYRDKSLAKSRCVTTSIVAGKIAVPNIVSKLVISSLAAIAHDKMRLVVRLFAKALSTERAEQSVRVLLPQPVDAPARTQTLRQNCAACFVTIM